MTKTEENVSKYEKSLLSCDNILKHVWTLLDPNVNEYNSGESSRHTFWAFKTVFVTYSFVD